MKFTKTFISFLLVLSILMCFASSSYALADTQEDVITDQSIEIITVPENCSIEERNALVQSACTTNSARGDLGFSSIAIVRSGTTTACDVIFNWVGFEICDFRYKQLTFNSTSILNPVKYASMGNGTTYTTHHFSISGFVITELGRIYIPTDVTNVRVLHNSPQVFSVSEPIGWVAVLFEGSVVIG